VTKVSYCYAGITNKAAIAARVKSDFDMPRKKYPANVVGSQIRKVRGRLGLTQEQLSAHCQLSGLDISRSSVGQIESRLRYVTDEELIVLASLLGVTADQLYPEEILKRYRRRKIKTKKAS
jgi:transcriptional regulator with XRE-family HTH domain